MSTAQMKLVLGSGTHHVVYSPSSTPFIGSCEYLVIRYSGSLVVAQAVFRSFAAESAERS